MMYMIDTTALNTEAYMQYVDVISSHMLSSPPTFSVFIYYTLLRINLGLCEFISRMGHLCVLGKIDSSGIKFTYTSTLRKFDAGVMELGLEYTNKMALSPRQKIFELSGYCIPECTAVVRNLEF